MGPAGVAPPPRRCRQTALSGSGWPVCRGPADPRRQPGTTRLDPGRAVRGQPGDPRSGGHLQSPIGCPVRPSPARLDNTLARSYKAHLGVTDRRCRHVTLSQACPRISEKDALMALLTWIIVAFSCSAVTSLCLGQLIKLSGADPWTTPIDKGSETE